MTNTNRTGRGTLSTSITRDDVRAGLEKCSKLKEAMARLAAHATLTASVDLDPESSANRAAYIATVCASHVADSVDDSDLEAAIDFATSTVYAASAACRVEATVLLENFCSSDEKDLPGL